MVNDMKEFMIRLLVAAFLTFAALALSSSAHGQGTEEHLNSGSYQPQQQSSLRIPETPSDRQSFAHQTTTTLMIQAQGF
jgi:hypothetical protein